MDDGLPFIGCIAAFKLKTGIKKRTRLVLIRPQNRLNKAVIRIVAK